MILDKFTDKEKSFILFYTNIMELTYHDVIRSAIRAGIAMNEAEVIGTELMLRDDVVVAVDSLEAINRSKSRLSREQKREIAWGNYQSAELPKSREFWWMEVCKLDGDYVTKTFNKSEFEIEEKEKENIYEAVRRLDGGN
jgi:hypothetical protein